MKIRGTKKTFGQSINHFWNYIRKKTDERRVDALVVGDDEHEERWSKTQTQPFVCHQ